MAGFGLTDTTREYIRGWRLEAARSAGLVFGVDIEGVRCESVRGDAAPEHRLGFGLGWRREGAHARDSDFEVRFEGVRLDVTNHGSPEHRLAVRMTARW